MSKHYAREIWDGCWGVFERGEFNSWVLELFDTEEQANSYIRGLALGWTIIDGGKV